MKLTPHQIEVARQVTAGKPLKQIAGDLQVSHKTVEYHLARLRRALGVDSNVGIVHYGIARLGVPLIFCLCLLLAPPLRAGSVPLAWDAVPGATSYILYATTNATLVETNLAAAQLIMDVDTNTVVTAYTSPAVVGVWRFAVTAKQGWVQSAPSNVLPLNVPSAPANLLTIVLQYSGTLEGIGTGPTNVFIRVKPGLP